MATKNKPNKRILNNPMLESENKISEQPPITELENKDNVDGVATENKKSDVMYLAPSIEGVVTFSTVFKNGTFPPKLKKIIKDIPLIRKLIVPIGAATEILKDVSTKSGSNYVIYKKIEKGLINHG